MFNQFFVSDAFAQAAETAAVTEDFSPIRLIPYFLIFAIFYFLMIRPQSKKYKEHQEMVNSLKSGTKVVTTGGIVGVVKAVHNEENIIEIEIAEGVSVKVLKNFVSEVLDKKKKEVKEIAHKKTAKADKKIK